MIYFNKPKKINWDLKSVKSDYKAKIYCSGSEMWQFSNAAAVEVLIVDQ